MLTPAKLIAAVVLLAALCGASSWSAWYVRGLQCDQTIAAMNKASEDAAAKQRAEVAQAQAVDAKQLAESSKRIDEQQKIQQTKTEVVTKEVIRYVQSPDHGNCELPADWVRAYNTALGVSSTMQADAAPGRSPDGRAGAVPAVAAGK